MKVRMLRCALSLCLGSALAPTSFSQLPYPDILYYKFDEGSGGLTANLADPGAGSLHAVVNGQTLAPTGGQFNGGLLGTGGMATTNFVDTGWVTNLPGDFTLSFWLDLTAITALNPFMYTLGDVTAASFRCFTNGASGAGGIVLKQVGGLTGVVIPGGANSSAPHSVAWVYDSSVPEMRGYLDGVLVAQALQPPSTVVGTAAFKVGSYDTFTSLLPGVVMDEFRLYGYALSDTEIATTWNVSLVRAPVTYCTAGTTTHGCVPMIAGAGIASASAGSGFTITVSNVEGQKSGLIFYGMSNVGWTPTLWANGSNSYLCVKAPTQRTPTQNSGGTFNACNGVLTIDWNAFIAATPGALGTPFNGGETVWAQAWFRDPPAPKTTNLSDGLQFVVQP